MPTQTRGRTQNMKLFERKFDLAAANGCPFGGQFDSDPSIRFHGTCDYFEDGIDGEGLRWQPREYSRNDIESVIELFSPLLWLGEHMGGLPVLRSFARADFDNASDSRRKDVYVTSSTLQTLLYASRDWAGGETCRAVRLALRDLWAYLDDPVFRCRARFQSWQRLTLSGCGLLDLNGDNSKPPQECCPVTADTVTFDHIMRTWDWLRGREVALGYPEDGMMNNISEVSPSYSPAKLRQALIALEPLRGRVERPFAEYRYGVVYALQLNEAELEALSSAPNRNIALPDVDRRSFIAKSRVRGIDPVWLDSEAYLKARTEQEFRHILRPQ